MLPFFYKIRAIEKKALVKGLCRFAGVQKGAYGDHVPQIPDRILAVPQGHPQGKITAQGKPHNKKGKVFVSIGNILNGAVGLLNKGAVKESFIQVVAVAVVAEIQAENIIPSPVKKSPGCQDICGPGTPLPPMEKENQAAGRTPPLARIKTKQADAVSRIDDNLAGLQIQLFLSQGADFQAG
jgi:hypothetical protein